MSDLVPKTKVNFLQDADGDLSSGRLMKLVAFFFAIFLGIAGAVLLVFAPGSAAADISKYMIATMGLFLGVATASEVVQKVTKS